MIKDPFAKERRAYHLAKKYSDELLEEAKQHALDQIEAIPAPVIPKPLSMETIAAEVMALLPKPKKLKNKKKAKKGVAVVSPEDVMAMIMASLEDVKTEYNNTGDTVIINEAPQRVIETVREIIRETGADVDYDEIYEQLDRRFIEWRSTFSMSGGSSALGLMTDVRLDGVPQDDQGNYLLGQISGDIANSFETINKNLDVYDHNAYKTDGDITLVVYDLPDGGTISKNIVRANGRIISVFLTGNLPDGITKIAKNIEYISDDQTYIYYSDEPRSANFIYENGDSFVYENGDNFVYN